MNLTAIIACKDRFQNLEYCIRSIATANSIPQVIIVDFGSVEHINQLAEKYQWLSVINVSNNTSMFHKTRALNIGIRAAKTKFVCLTDVDQLFQPNFFDVVFQTLIHNIDAFVRCETHFLPSLPAGVYPNQVNHDMYFKLLKIVMKTATKKPHGEGCCHGIAKDRLLEINGHDEDYIGWGFEDKDLATRLVAAGAQTTWVTQKTSMIHLPHKRNEKYFAPVTRNKNEKLYKNKLSNLEIVANKTTQWGML